MCILHNDRAKVFSGICLSHSILFAYSSGHPQNTFPTNISRCIGLYAKLKKVTLNVN